jgi:hypothetical protein
MQWTRKIVAILSSRSTKICETSRSIEPASTRALDPRPQVSGHRSREAHETRPETWEQLVS